MPAMRRETRIEVEHANGFTDHAFEDLTDRPLYTIQANRIVAYRLVERTRPVNTSLDHRTPVKPPYRVPSMEEIWRLPRSGLKAISFFSGCGGSSLGYRIAGFKVLWANEFVEEARATYRANFPETIVDPSDIRTLDPADVLKELRIRQGEIDLVDGSPPCASFSMAGTREKGWGKVKGYSDTQQRSDDLFFEYIRLLGGIRPKTFVAENVSGLVKGVAKGYFQQIIREMKALGYNVGCKVLDAQWLGVPQARQRTIFVGVREDLHKQPVFPRPLGYRYSIKDACPWIAAARQTPGGRGGTRFAGREVEDGPCPTILAGSASRSRTDDFEVEAPPVEEDAWMNGATGEAWDRTRLGESSERYFQLVRPDPGAPCPTVTALGGNAGLASVAHPTERRKFSIPELKRLASFPDDFVLTGTYQQQWERIGRAVPPLMMAAIARTIREEIFDDERTSNDPSDLPR